jgi:anti-anti-sigma factor
LDLCVAKERPNYDALPETPLPQPAGGPAPSGTSRYISTRLGWEPVGYPYASAHLMCSTDGLALVRVTEEIDLCTAPPLLVAVNKAIGDGARSIFIDLAQVSFFGAAGAMALLVARRQCQRRGAEFVLLRPSRPALRALALTDLVRPVIDLRDNAIPGDGEPPWWSNVTRGAYLELVHPGPYAGASSRPDQGAEA